MSEKDEGAKTRWSLCAKFEVRIMMYFEQKVY